jgi:hypothetical protein
VTAVIAPGRVGLSIASHSGLPAASVGALASAAEQAGFSAAPRLFGELDGGPSLQGVRDLVLTGDRVGAADRVPQHVAAGFVAHGRPSALAGRLAEYRAAGVDVPVVFPMPVDGDWGYQRTIAALAMSPDAEIATD